MTVVEFEDGTRCYMDGRLHRALEKERDSIVKQDRDLIIAIDGRERTGKSVLAQQICKMMDPSFTHDRMCQTTTEFINKADNLNKGQAICFDEAYTGLSSRSSRSKENRQLVNFFIKCGQKNLIIVIVLPTIRELDPYPRDHRITALLHVYTKEGKRGRWVFFNRHNLNLLLDYQKKFKYRYDFPRTRMLGRFSNQYVIDEEEYRKKKDRMLVQREESGKTRGDTHKAQRDVLLKVLRDEAKWTEQMIADTLKREGVTLARNTINDAINALNP